MQLSLTRLIARFSRLLAWFGRFDAPVLVQEMRVRQRGVRPFAVMGVYVLILSFVAMLVMYAEWSMSGNQSMRQMADLGKRMFAVLSMVQLGMIVLIVPAYSAGAVSSERERGTFDLLALTLLSSMAIVTQKLAAAIAQALMLIIASTPVVGIVFLLGGVSPSEVLIVYSLLIVTATLMGALGMLCSCCMRSSKTSTFVTYLVMFCFYGGLPIGGAWFLHVSRTGGLAADAAFPWMFITTFLFVGGVSSLMVYAPLSLILHDKPIWRTRAFRMAVFGGVYALLLLVLSAPWAMELAIASCYRQGTFLPMFVNPFVALFTYFDNGFGTYGGTSTAYWMIAATLGFSLGSAYLFRHISSARFAGLRRS